MFIYNEIREITGITNQFPINKHFRRHASLPPTTDWEPGLREATYQALRREQYTHPNLHEIISEAPVYGQQESIVPFGDITVLARGQLYSTPAGFKFVQESNQNDCDDCHSGNIRCRRLKCNTWRQNQGENIIALWTIKRIRHRDPYYEHRYELQYTVAPISATVNKDFLLPDGAFDYHIPGHVFIIKSEPTKLSYHKTEEPEVVHEHYDTQNAKENHKPGVLVSFSPDGYRYSSPAPHQHSEINFSKIQPQHEQIKEIEIYKALVDTLSLKTSTSADSPRPNNFYPDIFDLKTSTVNKIDSTTLSQLIFETEEPRFSTSVTSNKHSITNAFPDIFDLTITRPVQVTETTNPQIILEATLPVTRTSHALTQPSTKITTHVFDLNTPAQIPTTQSTHKTVTSQSFRNTQQPSTKSFITSTLTTLKPTWQSTSTKTNYVPSKTTAHEIYNVTPNTDTKKQPTKNFQRTSTSKKTTKTPLTTITFFTPVETEYENKMSVLPDSVAKSTTKQAYSDAEDIFGEPNKISQTGEKISNDDSTKDQLQRPDKQTETNEPFLYTTARNILTTTSYLNNVNIATKPNTFDKHGTSTAPLEDSENSENISTPNYLEDVLTTVTGTTDQSYKTENKADTTVSVANTEATALQTLKRSELKAGTATTETIYKETNIGTTQPPQTSFNSLKTTNYIINERELSTIAITDINERTTEESTLPVEVTTFPTHRSNYNNRITTQKILTEATTPKRSSVKSKSVNKIHEQKILSDIFGDDSVENKPQVIEKPLLSTSSNKPSNDDDFLFGTTTPHTIQQQTKVIYEDFFEASTAKPTTEGAYRSTDIVEKKSTPVMKNEPVPRTSMSYITSISFEVNKKNSTKNSQKSIKPDSMIKAKVSEMSTSDYQVFKAEMPEVQSEVLKPNINKEFDKIALTLVNHARTLAILNNKTEAPRTKRRRSYIPKKDRRKLKKEKEMR